MGTAFPLLLARRRSRRASASTPATILGANLLTWFESIQGYIFKSNVDGSGLVDGDFVNFLIDRRDTFASQTKKTCTSDANNELAWLAASKGFSPPSFDHFMNLSSTTTLTAPFTIYAVGVRANTSILSPCGGGNLSAFTVDDFKGFIIQSDNATASFTSTLSTMADGLILIRLRQTAAHSWRLAATGNTEVTLGTANDTFTVAQFGNDGAHGTDTPNCYCALLLVNVDTVAGGQDAAIRAYILSRFGVGL